MAPKPRQKRRLPGAGETRTSSTCTSKLYEYGNSATILTKNQLVDMTEELTHEMQKANH